MSSSPLRAAVRGGCALLTGGALVLATACGPPAAPEPPATAPSASPGTTPVERSVTFDGAGDTVHGTVALPPGTSGPVPGALIISGSGPTDRDGNSPARPDADTNANFARVLAAAGVASLRYDKLGSGETGLGGREAAEPVGYDVFEDQMAAAYAELLDQPEVDPERILVLGHSEGSLFALRAPQVVSGPPPAALVLAAPVGARYLDLLDRQVTEQVRDGEGSGALDAAAATTVLSDTRLAIARLRAGRPLPDDLAPELAPLFGPATSAFLRRIDAMDPVDLARDLPDGTRTLVLWGTADAQVTAAEVDRLMTGLPDGERVDLPGADHVFRRYDDSPGATALDAERPFAPDAAPALEEFLGTVW
ncbi:alpha/beta hydrolase family protein [Marinactinospora rubrisoli]|uniref:Alpha/beta hydrolase family protein n=1 Tax=Marinactinospora rubrisoli TaxID=2715399 RepID=A0ABW2KLH0_9ACTN